MSPGSHPSAPAGHPEELFLEELAAARTSARAPDFFIVGHAKCGTTAMHRMLDAHPQVFMPVLKETQFLSRAPYERTDAPRRRPARRPQTLDAYLELFAGVGDELSVGEASTEYLRTPAATRRIATLCPQARIVMAFREPASFLRSLHLQLLEVGAEDEPDLARALALEPERRAGPDPRTGAPWSAALQYTAHVRYAQQLRDYRESFGAERVMTIVYDDFRRDNEAVMREMLRFLGVDDTVAIAASEANPTVRVRSRRAEETLSALSAGGGPATRAARRALKSLTSTRVRRTALKAARRAAVDNAPAPLDEALAASLRERFAGEVAELGELLGRDLTGLWGYGQAGEHAASQTAGRDGG